MLLSGNVLTPFYQILNKKKQLRVDFFLQKAEALAAGDASFGKCRPEAALKYHKK